MTKHSVLIEGQNKTHAPKEFLKTFNFLLVKWILSSPFFLFMRWKWFVFRPAPFSIKYTLDENSFLNFRPSSLACVENMKICTTGCSLFFCTYSCFVCYTKSICHPILASPFIHLWLSMENWWRLEKDRSMSTRKQSSWHPHKPFDGENVEREPRYNIMITKWDWIYMNP